MKCLICTKGVLEKYSKIDGTDFYECNSCKSLHVDPDFLAGDFLKTKNYGESYWEFECLSSKERSYGSSIARTGEVFLYARKKSNRFIDVGTGPGYLLDSLSTLLPNIKNIFHDVELFPPPKKFRSKHVNYHIGTLNDINLKFDAGTCIEVIEHLAPDQLESLIAQLAKRSNPGALYYFNSAQPSFVKVNDPGYLDPHVRGHIFSYSLDALSPIFTKYGFSLIPMPGRDWGFLVEYAIDINEHFDFHSLMNRVWNALPENVENIKNNLFGNFVYTSAIEASRCYYEAEMSNQRASMVLPLQKKFSWWRKP